ncbi:MAG: PA14 domain-containing protein [Limisphaerales bacterium]
MTGPLHAVAEVPQFIRDDETFTTTLRYSPPSLLAADSANTITVEWSDTAGTRRTNSGSFRVGAYATLPASMVLPPGSAVTTDSGFKVGIYQIVGNLTPTSTFAESVLAGERGENVAELLLADENGYFVEPTFTSTIDYNLNSAPLGLSTFPGIPGFTDSKENFAAEILTYVEFPAAGFYQMGVRTDDGFILKAGDATNPMTLGAYEGEREPSDTVFGFVVPQAGVYPMRLVYYQTRGGGSVRWFSVTPSGVQILINDPEHPLALKAYRSTSSTQVPGARITITRTATSTTLSWSGGGALETSSTLAPNSWSTVQGATNPYTVPTTGTSAFYRVRN